MKDKIIEIWDKIGNVITTQTPNMTIYYDHFDAASDIADMVQKFVECITWDYLTFERGKVRYWRDSNDNEYTFDKLFTYWFDNIKDKEI